MTNNLEKKEVSLFAEVSVMRSKIRETRERTTGAITQEITGTNLIHLFHSIQCNNKSMSMMWCSIIKM